MLSKYKFNKRLKKACKKYLLAAKNVSPYDGTTLQDTIEPALEYFSLFFSAENPLFKNEQPCLLESVKSIQDSIQKVINAFDKYHQVFAYTKPLELLTYLIKVTINSNKYAIVLDFFAGSGTTGHAVMKLNAEDGGNRRFILCTNNENNICRDVTYERIKRVIAKENYKASLKYYKVDFVPKHNIEPIKNFNINNKIYKKPLLNIYKNV